MEEWFHQPCYCYVSAGHAPTGDWLSCHWILTARRPVLLRLSPASNRRILVMPDTCAPGPTYRSKKNSDVAKRETNCQPIQMNTRLLGPTINFWLLLQHHPERESCGLLSGLSCC